MFERFIIICIDYYFMWGENPMKRRKEKNQTPEEPDLSFLYSVLCS